MQFGTLLSGALAALAAAAGAAADCSPSHNMGEQCSSEGTFSCDPSCTNLMICHDGIMQVNNRCNAGCCAYRAGVPYCSC